LSAFGFLREIGCDQVQGYLIGRPMNREAVSAWMGPASGTGGNHRGVGAASKGEGDRQASAVAG
jgi:hypothetical protein